MAASRKGTPCPREVNTVSQQNPHGTAPVVCRWEEHVPLTLHGYLPFFADFLGSGDLFTHLVATCPLKFSSNNAPKVGDVVGTMVLSVLSGHTRYTHAQTLYGDTVAASLMGMGKVVSPDSMRRAFSSTDEQAIERWQRAELFRCYGPLLLEPYVLDLDPTVKILYGHQEGARVGYNPRKPGRPSHSLHSYFIGSIRVVLDVDVRPGNEHAGCYSHGRLWGLLDHDLPAHMHPCLIRGDIGFGNEQTMAGCEARNKRYLFKIRQSPNVKRMIAEISKANPAWEDVGAGWSGCESRLRLSGWTAERRVIVMRRKVHRDGAAGNDGCQRLPASTGNDGLLFPELVTTKGGESFEWAVLVTNLDLSAPAVAQLYRDRADCENAFDELKNQWGWDGFTTQDIKRSSMMARMTALVYNWWNIFCRLADPDKHMEAITSRPALQAVIGRMSKHGGKRVMHLSALGATAGKTRKTYEQIAGFLSSLKSTARQLTAAARWAAVLAQAFIRYLREKPLQAAVEDGQLLLPPVGA